MADVGHYPLVGRCRSSGCKSPWRNSTSSLARRRFGPPATHTRQHKVDSGEKPALPLKEHSAESNQVGNQILTSESCRKHRETIKFCAFSAASRKSSFRKAPRIGRSKKVGQNALGKRTVQPEIFVLTPKSGSEQLSEPSFYIARAGDELILEIHLCESFVAGAPQTIAPH